MGTLRDRMVDNFSAGLIHTGEQRIRNSRDVVKGDGHDFEFARERLEDEELTRRYDAEVAKRLGIEDFEEVRSLVDEAVAAADVDNWIGRAAEKLAKLKSIGV